MKSSLRHTLTALLLCSSLLLLPKLAQADSLHGCVSSAPNSIILLNDGDRQAYDLIGDTAAIKVGERVKVSGKRKKTPQASGISSWENCQKTTAHVRFHPLHPDSRSPTSFTDSLQEISSPALCLDAAGPGSPMPNPPMNYPVKDNSTKPKHAS